MTSEEQEHLIRCPLCESSAIAVVCAQTHLSRCDQCGLIFDNPRPTQAQIVAYYSKETKYDEWLADGEGRADLWKRRLKRIMKFRRQGRLLDVGAGIGDFLGIARTHFQVTGTEVSDSAVRLAKKRWDISLTQGYFEEQSFPLQFDVITLTHVLEHVPSPKKTLDHCGRWLKSQGLLVITVPNDVLCWSSVRNRFLRKMGLKKYQRFGELGLPVLSLDMSELHLSHFTPRVLTANLVSRGYRILDLGLDPYFSVSGFRKFRRYLRYGRYWIIAKLTGLNLYETMWITAQKP